MTHGGNRAYQRLESLRVYLNDVGFKFDARVSHAGVPHLVGHGASIAFFSKMGKFRIFTPYPSNAGRQNRIDFDDYQELHTYLEERERQRAAIRRK